VRARTPEAFHDVQYRDVVTDPMRVVRGIYERFAITPSAEADAAMRSWLAQNPQGKHGTHDYRAEEFGLDDARIRETFSRNGG
jgi:hypothetical protein